MEWDKDFITISVDRQEVLRLDLSVADPLRTSWPNPFTNDKKWLGLRGVGEPGTLHDKKQIYFHIFPSLYWGWFLVGF
jgi:hypothetical protein